MGCASLTATPEWPLSICSCLVRCLGTATGRYCPVSRLDPGWIRRQKNSRRSLATPRVDDAPGRLAEAASPDQHAAARDIAASAATMHRMVLDLLDISRAEDG